MNSVYVPTIKGVFSGTEVNDPNYRPLDSLTQDYRPWECSSFELTLYNLDPIPVTLGNRLLFMYQWMGIDSLERFPGMEIFLCSNRLKYGHIVNIKALLENTEVCEDDICWYEYGPPIELEPLTPETEYCFPSAPCEPSWGVYGYAYLIICDVNTPEHLGGSFGICPDSDCCGKSSGGIINFVDFACLATDWKKPQGKYCWDVSGPNGIPDGYVDFYDLAEFVEIWLIGTI